MKNKFFSWILVIDILTIILIIAVVLIPSSLLRTVLGLPFVLYFPGFVFLAALIPANRNTTADIAPGSSYSTKDSPVQSKKAGIDVIERAVLSVAISLAITAFVGLGLNYSPWGINTLPVLLTLSILIFLLSVVAFTRQPAGMDAAYTLAKIKHLRLPGRSSSAKNRVLTSVLCIAVFAAAGFLIYSAVTVRTSQTFNEFYILGNTGKADNYPTAFVMNGFQVVNVRYGETGTLLNAASGQLTVVIVNHSAKIAFYSFSLKIDGQETSFEYNGNMLPQLGNLELPPDGKWEGKIGFKPLHSGSNQKVEFHLYKDGGLQPDNTLQLFVDVTGS